MEEHYTYSQRSMVIGVIYAVITASLWETPTFKVDKRGKTFLSFSGVKVPFDWTYSNPFTGGDTRGTIKSLVVYRNNRGVTCLVNVDSGRYIGKRAFSIRFRLMETREGFTAWTGKTFASSNFLTSVACESKNWLKQGQDV